MNLREKSYHKVLDIIQILPYRILRLLDQFNNHLLIKHKPPQSVINQLQKIGCDTTSHIDRNLLTHFQGTYQLLKKWGNQESVCLAGLCHALYGTETFPTSLVPLEKRQEIVFLIGEEAEKLVYYYSIITRKHFTEILRNGDNLAVKSRLDGATIQIKELEFRQLLEIFLADRLEQIFSLNYRDRYEYKFFFIETKSYLSQLGFKEFSIAYNYKS